MVEEKIKRLNERLEIRILSQSRLDNISHSFASLTRERYYKHSKMKFAIPTSSIQCQTPLTMSLSISFAGHRSFGERISVLAL